MKLGSLSVGVDYPPVVVAELSGNHNGSIDRALSIIDEAAAAGAHAVKIQTYTADTMTLDLSRGEFVIEDPASLWHGRTLYDLYQEAATPWDWHEPLFRRAHQRGLVAFSTPFDQTAVDFLEALDAPAYKIASFEITDLPLIRSVAATGKPVIISTGMATVQEIDEAVRAARGEGCRELMLLKCTSNYPADPSTSNLAAIPRLRDTFACEVGLSDHTVGIGAAVASVAFGASLIEKHITLSRADGGVDAAFSLEPPEMAGLIREARAAWEARGTDLLGPSEAERPSLAFRRSLYICADLRAGDVLTAENLRAIRPGHGLPPKHLAELLGRRVSRDVKRGTPASWSLIA